MIYPPSRAARDADQRRPAASRELAAGLVVMAFTAALVFHLAGFDPATVAGFFGLSRSSGPSATGAGLTPEVPAGSATLAVPTSSGGAGGFAPTLAAPTQDPWAAFPTPDLATPFVFETPTVEGGFGYPSETPGVPPLDTGGGMVPLPTAIGATPTPDLPYPGGGGSASTFRPPSGGYP